MNALITATPSGRTTRSHYSLGTNSTFYTYYREEGSGLTSGLTSLGSRTRRRLTPQGVGTHRCGLSAPPGCHSESRGAPHLPPPRGFRLTHIMTQYLL